MTTFCLTNTLCWIMIVLAHWHNSPRVDMCYLLLFPVSNYRFGILKRFWSPPPLIKVPVPWKGSERSYIYDISTLCFSCVCCPIIYLYDFRIKTMPLPPVGRRLRMSYLRYMWLFAHSGVQHSVLCFCFDLSTLCWQFLWIVLFHCSLRWSLMIIWPI